MQQVTPLLLADAKDPHNSDLSIGAAGLTLPSHEHDILLIGDKYHETATLESTEGPTPGADIAFPGGVWYVKKVLDQSPVGRMATVLTYPLPPTSRETAIAAKCTFKKFPRYWEKPGDQVLRIKHSGPCKLKSIKIDPLVWEVPPTPFLIIEDMDICYRKDGCEEWKPLLTKITSEKPPFEDQPPNPRIAVLLGGELPDLSKIDPHKTKDDLWSTLLQDHRDHTIVILSADLLRFMGANISRRISWERTAQDFVTELHCHPRLQPLSRFSHLIVRFGVTGAIHCFRSGGYVYRRLYYDSAAHDGLFRDVSRDGGIIGNNSVFLACVLAELLASDQSTTPAEKIGAGIKAAIPACQRFHHFGYPELPRVIWLLLVPVVFGKDWLENWPNKAVFDRAYPGSKQGTDFDEAYPTSIRYIKSAEIPLSVPSWSIVKQTAVGSSMMKLAKEIVFRGIRNSLNLPEGHGANSELSQYHGPIAHFGHLTAVDREEIESFRTVSNLIKHYTTSNELRPLSIAVFGPPGSGKTFAMKQIADQALPGGLASAIAIDLSQLSSLEELCAQLAPALSEEKRQTKDLAGTKRALSYADMEKLPFDDREIAKGLRNLNDFPLIFFDEFDCELNGKRLGWLKSFLSPMEDGAFGSVGNVPALLLYRSILVFAGGTKRTYRDFSGEDESLNDEERLLFETAKGPDFASRLRAHINMKGIDRVSSSDTVFLLRRALMLRQHLKDAGLLVKNEFGEKEAQVDYSVIHAMLHATTYKHGARSIKALIESCSPLDGRIEKASLPAPGLLDMHVNSIEFHDSLAEYSPAEDDPKPQEQTYRLS